MSDEHSRVRDHAKPRIQIHPEESRSRSDSLSDYRPEDKGFGEPIYEWFFDQFGEFVRRELSEFCEKTDFLDRSEVLKIVRDGRGCHACFCLILRCGGKNSSRRKAR